MTNSDRLQEIREREQAATKGPWGWRGNVDNRDIFLCTLHNGWRFVLDSVRWGTQQAQFRFQPQEESGMVKAAELAIYEVCPTATERTDRRVYRGDIVGIRHPDAEFIAASREDIPYLLQLVTEQQREIDRYRKALEAVNEFAKEDDICTHKTIGAQHGKGACFVCLIQATAQGALRGENGPFESDDEPEAKGYRKQERPI